MRAIDLVGQVRQVQAGPSGSDEFASRGGGWQTSPEKMRRAPSPPPVVASVDLGAHEPTARAPPKSPAATVRAAAISEAEFRAEYAAEAARVGSTPARLGERDERELRDAMVRTGGRLPALGMVRMAQGFQHRKRGV